MFEHIPLSDIQSGGAANVSNPSNASHPSKRTRRHLHLQPHEGAPMRSGCVQQVAAVHASILNYLGMIHMEVGALQRSAAASAQAAAVNAAAAASAQAAAAAAAAQAAAPAPALAAAPCPTAAEMLESNNAMVAVNKDAVLGTPVRQGGETQAMVVPKNDEFVGASIVAFKSPFEGHLLTRMVSFIRPGSVVLDVGANLGTYTIWFAKAVGAKGTVYSFEPQPYIYQVLCTNIIINGHRNVRALNTAASFRPGTTSMAAALPDGASTGLQYSATTVDDRVNYGGRRLGLGGEPVPMITLDSLNLTDVSFIKLDAQGSEPLVVWGARETIKRCQPVINFEVMAGFNVTEEMRVAMQVPDKVMSFTIQGFLEGIGYRYLETVAADQFWVPQGYQAAA